MFKSIFTKSLYSLRWQLLGWGLAVGLTAFITMALYNSFNQNGIEDIVNSMPESLKPLVGSVADFKTIPGYIGQQVFGPNIIILTIIMSVLLFVGISVNEEDDRRLQTLLSLPVTRTSVYFQKWLAVTLVIAFVSACIVAGLVLGLIVADKTADMQRVWLTAFDAWIMNTAYGLVAYCIAMLTGKKGLTIAAASGYAALSFFVSSLAPAVDKLKEIDKLSIFHYYNQPQIMQHGLNGKHLAVLITVVAILTIVGWLGFTRRNIET
jgi:ABC-2 type transport system permease protein